MNKDEIETDIVKIEDFLKRSEDFAAQTQKTRLSVDAYRDNKELSHILKDASFLIDTGEPRAKEAIEYIFQTCVSAAFQFLSRDWFYSNRAEDDAHIQRRNLELVDLLARILRNNILDKNMMAVMFHLFSPNSIFHQRRTRSGPPSYESVTVPEKYRFVTGVNENVFLQEIIERFGKQGGFQYANSQLSSLDVELIPIYFCTFAEAIKVVSESCAQYFLPMKEKLSEYLASLTDKEIKSLDLRSDAFGPLTVITSFAKILAHFGASQKSLTLEHFNLLHRVLKLSTYNGRMFALNEIMTQLNSTKQFYNDSNKLSAKEAADWTKEALLPVMLRDSLHLKQYVERVVNVLIFMMDHDVLTTSDIDMIWNSKLGAHPAIILNIDDLFASIADKLSDNLLGYLLDKFRNMWLASDASKKDREQLLSLVKRLAEDPRIGDKILDLLWGMATGVDVSEEILNDTLQNLVKILDNRSVDRDKRKIRWLSKLAAEFKQNPDLTIPVIKLIELIGNDLPDDNYTVGMTRKKALEDLQNNEQLIHAVISDMIKFTSAKETRPKTIHGHLTEISLRLSFIKYILQEARLYLEYKDAVAVWEKLVVPGDPEMRELGFTWFKSIMGQEPDLNSVSIFNFFASHILAMEPEKLTPAGVTCFYFFFNAISTQKKPDSSIGSENPSQDGINYLWKTLCSCDAVLAPDVIDIINNYYTNMFISGPAQNHNDFFEECIQRIKTFHDTLKIITDAKESKESDAAADKSSVTLKICRIVDLFQRYLSEFPQNRMQDDNLALGRSWRGAKKIYTVQIEQQNIKVDMHSNSNIRHLSERLQHQFPDVRKDLIILPEQNSQHILESEQMLESSCKNEQVNFYARFVQERLKARKRSVRPDDSLENHPTFIADIIELMELALDIGEYSLVNSIMKLVLVLPGDAKAIRIAIMKKKDLKSFFNSESQSMNWYNLCLLRSLLLPTEPTQQTRDVLAFFFASNGPAAIMNLLDLSQSKIVQTSRPEIILHVLETLAEVQRFITLIHVRSIGNTSVWDTLRCLDEYLYGTAENIPIQKGTLISMTPTIIQGTWQICHKVSKTSADSYISGLFEDVYKTAFESLSWLLVTNKICAIKTNDNKLRDSFFEFVLVMLLHQNSNYRRTTSMFLMVVYSGKYLNNQLADKETTVKLANYLYDMRSMTESNAEVAEEIFSFTADLFDQFYIESNYIEGNTRIMEMIQWLEARIAAKEANEFLLKGHLELALVFVKSLTKTELLQISDRLLKILNEIIFPVSPLDRKTLREARASGCDNGAIESVAGGGDTPMSPRKLGSPLCDTQASVHAAMNLLVEMTKGIPESFQQLAVLLKRNWHSQANLERFDVVPTSQRKSKTGYVGLKNGGATCYLNAVVQQLFMIHPMKNALLSGQLSDPKSRQNNSPDKQYRYKIFNIFQRLIGHLSSSEQTFFVPRQFWDHVKLCGQHINVRDQQDAMEFYSQIVDTLDEAMKDDGEPSAIQEFLGGTFSDQKICKDCPHRYSREEAFTSISVDVRSQHSLQESLNQFVKGDLLDGENSYYCETCDTKVAAIKRLCIAKLPPYLCIQLKRFDYDWEREESIKFNDYFEFPRVLNMAPFTEAGIDNSETEVSQNNYRLKGVVVHSGQASGGHYYSFVRETAEPNSKWLKFDDCEVSEIDLSDEQLAGECFGGDQGEFWDGRRNQSRRGRRWWNAYLLFYESIEESSIQNLSQGLSDISVNSSTSESFCVPAVDRRQMPVTMPSHIKQEVEQQNAEMRHQRMMFSQEFIDFHINLVHASYEKIREEWRRNGGKGGKGIRQETKQLAKWALDLGMSFVVNIASKLHQQYRKVNFIQNTEDISWLTIIKELVITDDSLADSVLKYFTPEVLRQYLFVCPNEDIRLFVAKILAVCCQKNCSLRERCMQDLVSISSPDNRSNVHVSEQYFLILDLLLRFPLQEGLAPPLYIYIDHGLLFNLTSLALQSERYQSSYRQSAGMAKLYSLVATLARHCNMSRYTIADHPSNSPYGKNIKLPTSEEVMEKPDFDPEAMKLFEDDKGANCTTIIRLIRDSELKKQTEVAFDFTKFILFNNRKMSKLMGDDIVWNFVFGNTPDIPTFWTHLLYCYCVLDDALQHARIMFILRNAHENGLLGIIEKTVRGLSNSNTGTRAYQALKLIIKLMASEDAVRRVIYNNEEISRSLKEGLKWLKMSLAEAPSGHSHDHTQGYELMRTASAERICDMGYDLLDTAATSEPDTVSSTTSGTSESSSRYEPASQ